MTTLKIKTSENQMISEVFCTQDRDRTGTPKNWCLRPARLPIPPPGLVLNWCANIETFFNVQKLFKGKILKFYFQTIVGQMHSFRKLLIFNIMQAKMMADVG